MSLLLWLLELVEMSMTPRNHHSWFWTHQTIQIKQRKRNKHSWTFLETIVSEKFISSKIESFRKDKDRTSLRSVLSSLENLEYGIKIFQQSWNESLWFSIQLQESLPLPNLSGLFPILIRLELAPHPPTRLQKSKDAFPIIGGRFLEAISSYCPYPAIPPYYSRTPHFVKRRLWKGQL